MLPELHPLPPSKKDLMIRRQLRLMNMLGFKRDYTGRRLTKGHNYNPGTEAYKAVIN